MAGAFWNEKLERGEMAIALFATFVNQTPLFGNGAAGIIGGKKNIGGRGKIIELWMDHGRCFVSELSSTTRCVVCVPRLGRSFSA